MRRKEIDWVRKCPSLISAGARAAEEGGGGVRAAGGGAGGGGGGAAGEEVGEDADGVRDVEDAAGVRVGGLEAARLGRAEIEVAQDGHRVAQVHRAARIG